MPPVVKRRARPILAATCADPGCGDEGHPPAERYAHDVIGRVPCVDAPDGPRVRRVLTQTPIDRYWRRGEITEAHFKAAERLRAVFHRAGLQPQVVGGYAERIARGGPVDPEDRGNAAARLALRATLSAVGPVLSPILVHVVCHDHAALDWAALRGRSGKRAGTEAIVTLRLALETLALHYGLIRRPEIALDRRPLY